jgi:3-hydroxyacyl-CoA dehydrogenase/enoyl-CoA hydratase/3-hydroxybutyryl-CoA epimerase
MPLVEVVRGSKTTPEVVAAAVEFVKKLKKIPIVVRGSPGFLVNRLLMPYLNEAGVMLGEGVSVKQIDDSMLEFGMPMGPLRLVDEVGIDVAVHVAQELADAFKGRMTVAPLLLKLHEKGLKGRKGGAGFYSYRGKQESLNPAIKNLVETHDQAYTKEWIQKRLLGVMIAEAKLCMAEKVVETEDDIDTGMIFGTGFPPFRGGLVKYARDAGLWGVTD